MSARVSVGIACLSLAMRARLGEVDRLETSQVRSDAEQTLPPGDGLRVAITAFATALEVAGDPEAMRAAGDRLKHAVMLALQPAPPGLDRADIHG